MKKFSMRRTLAFVPCLAVASCSATLVDPCDVLVNIQTKTTTNAYLVANDHDAATGLARHKGRVELYKCSADSVL